MSYSICCMLLFFPMYYVLSPQQDKMSFIMVGVWSYVSIQGNVELGNVEVLTEWLLRARINAITPVTQLSIHTHL